MKTDVLDKSLGDPLFYTKRIIATYTFKPRDVNAFKNMGGDPEDADQLAQFRRSNEFLDYLCEYDYTLFAERILGYTVKEFHVEWTNDFLNHDFSIIMAPRDHGKTAWLVGFILWNIYYKKVTYILLMSETLTQAKMIMGGEFSVKEHIEANTNLNHLYPRSSDRKWSETFIKCSNGVRFEVAGFGQRLRGRHPGLVILDDVLSDQNSGTKEQRKKVFHYYSTMVVPMTKKAGRVILIGTAHHPEDLLHTLGKSDEYAFKKYRAVINEQEKIVLWPEKHSYEALQRFRKTHGELAYQREYQNNPIADSLSYFPQELLDFCKDDTISYEPAYRGNNRVCLGGDLSPPGGAKDGDGDYTVFLVLEVIEREMQDTLRVLHYNMFRDTPNNPDKTFSKQQIDILTNMCIAYSVDDGFIEEVLFQAIYTKELIPAQMHLPIKGKTVSKGGKLSPASGFPYVRTLMEKGCIKFPYKTQADKAMTNEICAQFVGITLEDGKLGNKVYHDDIPTALWMAVESSKTSAKPMFMRPYDKYAAKSKHLHIPRFRINRRPFRARGGI